jgi:hypothetical protein
MSLNLTDGEIHGLIAYARDKFGDERYPFAPALRPTREAFRAELGTAKKEQAAALTRLGIRV